MPTCAGSHVDESASIPAVVKSMAAASSAICEGNTTSDGDVGGGKINNEKRVQLLPKLTSGSKGGSPHTPTRPKAKALGNHLPQVSKELMAKLRQLHCRYMEVSVTSNTLLLQISSDRTYSWITTAGKDKTLRKACAALCSHAGGCYLLKTLFPPLH